MMNTRVIREKSDTHFPSKAPIYMAILERTINSDRFTHFFLLKYGAVLISSGTKIQKDNNYASKSSLHCSLTTQNEEQRSLQCSMYFPIVAEYCN
jgi:hypothetical protein